MVRLPSAEALSPVATAALTQAVSLGGALLYLPDANSPRLAARSLVGCTLTVRSLVAAVRAGAPIIAIPVGLRDAAVERALARLPALKAAAIRWLEPGSPEPAGPSGQPWLLVPVSALVQARTLHSLAEPPAPPQGAVLAASLDSPAPVAVLPLAALGVLWRRLAAGGPTGPDLVRLLREVGPQPRKSPGLFIAVSDEGELARAEDALLGALGIEADTDVDRYFHRRCSRWITKVLVRTPVTPNHVSMASLAIGGVAIWCFWRATPLSALWGLILYAIATIVDHADGEIARLSLQESRSGANLDWTIDTIIHSGLVLGMAVTAGGRSMQLLGLFSALGVTLSALFARYLPLETAAGANAFRALKVLGSRDFVYMLLLSFVIFRWRVPSLLHPLAVVVAAGSQAYWIACLTRIRQSRSRR